MSDYTVVCENIGIEHDMIIAAGIWDSGGVYVMDLPWYVIKDTPTGFVCSVNIGLGDLDLPVGSYVAKCRACESYSPGEPYYEWTMNGCSAVAYLAGTGSVFGTLDTAEDAFTVGAGVGMNIMEFDIRI